MFATIKHSVFVAIAPVYLAALSAIVGCVPEQPDDRYGGRVDPCDVVVNHTVQDAQVFRSAGQVAARRKTYWQAGPYPTWNTSPSPRCPNNPVTPSRLNTGPMPIYITYPSTQNPTSTGKASLAKGPWPVVIFAHANNDLQCEIFDRYFSLHDHWASWGYVVVSVDSTIRNCLPGSTGNLRDRIDDQLWALTTLKQWNANPNHWLHDQLDLDQVVFAGHSRGGGGSFIAARESGVASPVIINLQGVDVTSFGFGEPEVSIPTIGVTASRDVDLNYPSVEPNEELLTGPYHWVTILGGIHAYSADTAPIEPDDDPAITKTQQHQSTGLFTTAFLAHHLGVANGVNGPPFETTDSTSLIYGFDGVREVQDHITKVGAIVRWNQRGPGTLIDSFDIVGPNPTNKLGLVNTTTDGLRAEVTYTYSPLALPSSLKLLKARALYLTGNGQWWTSLPSSTLPASGVVMARVKRPDDISATQFSILARSGEAVVRLDGADFIGPMALTYRYTQLRVPVEEIRAKFNDPEVVIDAIGVELSTGALLLDDLRVTIPPSAQE